MVSDGEEEEQAVFETIPIELWEWLVLPRLHPFEARAVGRCGGSVWLAFLAAQQLRRWPRPSTFIRHNESVRNCAFSPDGL